MATTPINSITFFDKLNKNILFSGTFSVNEEININDKNGKWEFKSINGVVFREHVLVSDLEINSGLSFSKCEFKKGITFNNVTSNNFDPAINTSNTSVNISECKGQYIRFENNCNFSRAIKLQLKSEIESFIFLRSTIINGGLIIHDSTIKGHLEFTRSVSELKISKSIIEKSLRMGSSRGDIAIVKSKIIGTVKFWDIRCPNSFILNHNTFDDTFDIKASHINSISIHGDIFNRKAKLENRDDTGQNISSNLNEIYITEANFIEGFEFDGMSQKLSRLTLPISPNLKGVLKIVGWKIDETLISGINQNLNLIFKRIDFKRILFNDFTNFGVINIDECQADNHIFKTDDDPDSSMIISNTSLGNTRFSEYDFDSFDFINTSNVSFNGIEASNVIWFSEEKLQISGEKPSNEINFRRKREIYREIKQALKAKGNQIDSLIFQAREMKAYRNELKKSDSYSLADRILMIVNQSNDYGINWIKPLVLIISITVISYTICLPHFSNDMTYNLSHDFISWDIFIDNFIEKLPALAQMFNPVRRFTTTYGENTASILYFIDLLHRIILGILIFQLIRAFRRLASK
jgi:hypothetical protein